MGFRVSFETATLINYGIVLGLASGGFFHETPRVWYECATKAFIFITFGCFFTQLAFQVVASRVGRLIQTSDKAQPEHVLSEVRDTVLGTGIVVGCLAAWPMARYRNGHPIALRDSLEECGVYNSVPLYLLKAVVGLLFADFYNYWKHRAFHHKLLWPFHKIHHAHHNPSALAGYAVSPAYGLATFFPVVLFSYPELGLYLPVHWPLLLFYLLLNHYLHCGYVIEPLERVLAPFGVMTSAWHNVHHEKGRVGFNYKAQTFGEMFTFWDLAMGTYPQGHYLHAGSGIKKEA